ncbi:hypothetical protein B0J17DRAFT_627939 [Rhizoctonia solani]|nr:hypothetical protein B0J17DRAFT_627939 [Rhizoctonia solani]
MPSRSRLRYVKPTSGHFLFPQSNLIFMLVLDYSQCVPECRASVTTTVAASSATPVQTGAVMNKKAHASNTVRAALQRRATEIPVDIMALDGWAAGSYLQKASENDAAILGQRTWGLFSQGESIHLMNNNPGKCIGFLNLTTKPAETSYKPLALEAADTMLGWNSNGPSNTLSTSSGDLYLQTGSDLPNGNCTTTRLQLRR